MLASLVGCTALTDPGRFQVTEGIDAEAGTLDATPDVATDVSADVTADRSLDATSDGDAPDSAVCTEPVPAAPSPGCPQPDERYPFECCNDTEEECIGEGRAVGVERFSLCRLSTTVSRFEVRDDEERSACVGTFRVTDGDTPMGLGLEQSVVVRNGSFGRGWYAWSTRVTGDFTDNVALDLIRIGNTSVGFVGRSSRLRVRVNSEQTAASEEARLESGFWYDFVFFYNPGSSYRLFLRKPGGIFVSVRELSSLDTAAGNIVFGALRSADMSTSELTVEHHNLRYFRAFDPDACTETVPW
ncbi:MAG: hypothetical protein AAGF12_38400 [Myxococcota bacterium]